MATISMVVPAAGCGARANLSGNKVLAPLCGRPLLWWTLRALTDPAAMPYGACLQELVIAARRDEFALIGPLLQAVLEPQAALGPQAAAPISIRLIEGGDTRQGSVFNAVRAAAGEFALVHDAARPLVSASLIARVVEAALQNDAAIAALPVSDTVKRAAQRGDALAVRETLPRESIHLAQTPQVFRRELLLRAFEDAARDGFHGSDCASCVERLNHPVAIVAGEERNFKVTYAADLGRAATLLQDAEPAEPKREGERRHE